MHGWLALEDGTVARGRGCGAAGTIAGELVFNTAMTGYQEALTDPSYAGQLLMFTFPQIGNYGFAARRDESAEPQVRGCLVREWCRAPHQGRDTLDTWLSRHGVVGLEGVDTRALTVRTREAGTLRAVLCTDSSLTPEEGAAQARGMVWPATRNLVAGVSTTESYRRGRRGPRVTLLDLGVKRSIVTQLAQRCHVTVVPWDTRIEAIAATSPALLFLSNGPGDPAHPALHGVVELLRAARRRWPVVGICLGHQLLALALGGTTTKLRYGHRGVNQPVYDTVHDRVFITSQNHGYAVNHLPEGVAQTFVNLNDDTCEGLPAENCWSVQFHPEATPGPTDARALFHRVLQTATPDGEPAMREADSTTDDERPAGGGGSA